MKEKIFILGAGESGVGAALLAKSKGMDVFVSDNGPIKEIYRVELIDNNIEFEENGHEKILSKSLPDIVVKSPGIPDTVDIVKYFKDSGCEIISEIELGVRYAGQSRFIAITGTNGKTTTTLLTYHILKYCGLNVGLAGNVGSSLARQIANEPKENYVVEISSFQLDDLFSMHASTAVITNITPDHLNRYDNSFSNYIDSKFRILQNMDSNDHLIVHLNDQTVQQRLFEINPNVDIQNVSLSNSDKAIAVKGDTGIRFSSQDQELPLEQIPLKGDHNYLNLMMAVQAALNCGVNYNEIKTAIRSFRNAPHRLEWIADIEGISYVNDSKATNVDSVYYALGAFDSPITWIAGGVDKGNDYDLIRDLVKSKVHSLICLGTDNQKLKNAFMDVVPRIMDTTDIREAARMALKYAEKNDTVLLSPACASFDLFKNYEDRGEKFREAVLELKVQIETKTNN